MISRIVVTNPNGDTLPLVLTSPETSGLIVRDITGLGPPKSNVNLRENVGISGSTFNSARTPSRNIVLTLDYLATPTIEAARLRTYKYFPTESLVRLDITTDAGTYYIYGVVEANDALMFSANTGCVVSILCADPWFQTDDGLTTGVISEIASLFEFPFENDENTPELIFGERIFQSIDFVVPVVCSVPVEPTIRLWANGGAVSNPRIYFYAANDPGNVDSLEFEFGVSFPDLADGDYLEIVCERQNKSITRHVYISGDNLNYLGALKMNSSWPVFYPGNNQLSYEADSGGAYIRFEYEYVQKFVGV